MFYEQIGINAPFIICCSILNARDYTIPTKGMFSEVIGKVDRDILCINDLYIDNINDNSTEHILKPIFDSIWNACGHEKCYYYQVQMNYLINEKIKTIKEVKINEK